MNAPPGVVGTTVQSASEAVTNLGFTITPDQLQAAAQQVEEQTLIARTGGAPTLAVGMSTIFSGAFGGDALKAFWYHFAIMFEALFILTTVDAGTRVGRFMLQDTIGNVWKPMARPSWRPGVYATSAIVVGAWGYFLWVGVTDPLGGINQLFPLFGIANQLLAAVALTVATTILIKSGRVKWAWVTAVPLAWDVAVTLSASWYKIFSSDPLIGFFAQRDKYQEALDAGKVIPPAKSLDDVSQIVTNSTVDGVLSILFAALIIIVIADAARVWWQTLSGRREPVLAEVPAEESHLWAPSGLFPTAEDRAHQAELRTEQPVGAGRDGGGGSGGDG
jgi:carbon starvation protein